MELTRQLCVKIHGVPAPKGSLRHVGKGRLIEDNPDTVAWRALVARAGRAWKLPEPIDGPVIVEATITLQRPTSVKPASRPWPHVKSPHHGDVDKLARTILDGLQDAAVITDDAQVVQLVATKVYPDTPNVPDKLDRPGAVLRLLPAIVGPP